MRTRFILYILYYSKRYLNFVIFLNRTFVPRRSKIPSTLVNEHLKIRVLKTNDLEKVYGVVILSLDQHEGEFGPGTGLHSPELTMDQHLIDLYWHQKEFQID